MFHWRYYCKSDGRASYDVMMTALQKHVSETLAFWPKHGLHHVHGKQDGGPYYTVVDAQLLSCSAALLPAAVQSGCCSPGCRLKCSCAIGEQLSC